MKEVWKDCIIKGYEHYQVSSFGRVRKFSKDKKESYLIPIDNGIGYKQVHLCKQGTIKKILLHRLVAMHFIPKFDKGLNFVHLKDHSPTNARVENLTWGRSANTGKPVIMSSKDGVPLKEFPSMKRALKYLKKSIHGRDNIRASCKNEARLAYGYKWQFKFEYRTKNLEEEHGE
jgi:hypothetical protein